MKTAEHIFSFQTKKGNKLSLDEIQCDSSALGLAIERIEQQKTNLLSWNNEEDSFKNRKSCIFYKIY